MVGVNSLYYNVQRRVMFNTSIKLISPLRLIGLFFLMDAVYRETFIKGYFAQKYEVDLNPLFDCDEDFLYENSAFRALIKKVAKESEFLVNPNFDLSSIRNEHKNVYFKKYLKNAPPESIDISLLMKSYSSAFNMPYSFTTDAYSSMMKKYSDFFESEKEENY
jgi:hypothetical protein